MEGQDQNHGAKTMEEVKARLREITRELEAAGNLDQVEKDLQQLLPDAAGVQAKAEQESPGVPGLLSEIHLMLARCHRAQGRIKDAVADCNSALECRKNLKALEAAGRDWREPFLYRSALFRTLHAQMRLGREGQEESEEVKTDRKEANIIVDPEVEQEEEQKGEQIIFKRMDHALSSAKDGQKIFLERGKHRVTSSTSSSSNQAPVSAPFFLLGKSVSIVGASTADCVLEYAAKDSSKGSSRLDTFLICGTSADSTTFLKRLTFRNYPAPTTSNSCTSPLATRFLGVAAGRVHIEDCLFDGGSDEDGNVSAADAIYASSRICGHLRTSYPSPVVTVRFCVFDRCRSFASVTAMTAEVNLKNCLFFGSRLSALQSASINADDCEFIQTWADARSYHATMSCTSSSLFAHRCYVHADETAFGDSHIRQAMAVSSASRGEVTGCLMFRSGNGVACVDSDLICEGNIMADCSKRFSSSITDILDKASIVEGGESKKETEEEQVGLNTAVSVRETSGRKVVVKDNLFLRCDVGLHVGKDSAPAVRANIFEASTFTGVFGECGAKPNLVENCFLALLKRPNMLPKDRKSGLGVLLMLGSRGMLGRNRFVDFELAPVMCFASCQPLLADNTFKRVLVDRTKQEAMEAKMRESFSRDLFEKQGSKGDSEFYIVDSKQAEKELKDIILKGVN